MSVPYLAQATDNQQLEWLDGGVMRVMLDGTKTDGRLAMLRSAAAGGTASPVHVHVSEDEVIVLLQGSGIFWVGEQRYELSEGGVAFLPRNIPHAYRLTSETVDTRLWTRPTGRMARPGHGAHSKPVLSTRIACTGHAAAARRTGRRCASSGPGSYVRTSSSSDSNPPGARKTHCP
jgi:quercetin dioxygenase-like cupin family protein